MGAVVCDYLLDDARNQHEQTASFNFTPSRTTSDFTFMASCDLNRPRWPSHMGVVSRNGWKTKSPVISTGVARPIQGFWLIVVAGLSKHEYFFLQMVILKTFSRLGNHTAVQSGPNFDE
jgi:hypothetical protein